MQFITYTVGIIMRIVHLSDFHLDNSNLTPSNNVVFHLGKCLKDIHSESPIDLIIFTGDMVNQGGKSFDNISQAFEKFYIVFINRLCKTINIDESRFIFTIGNHDICRNADNKAVEIGLSQMLKDPNAIAEIIDKEDPDQTIKRIEGFKDFEKKFYSSKSRMIEYKFSKFASNFKININGHTVGITALNTAWRCWDSNNDRNNISMGPSQIQNSLEFLDSCDLKIAISHHHISWLRQDEVVQDERLLSKNYDLYLCGHTHSPSTDYKLSPEGNVFQLIVPGILSKNINETNLHYLNGFAVLDYDFDNNSISESIYRQDEGSAFYKDLNFGDKGNWVVNIPTGDLANIINSKKYALLSVKESASDLNQHLLSYNTDTSAPKSIPEIFVMPNMTRIDRLEDDNDEFREDIIDDLSTIIESPENSIFFGIKESGKTVLLDKIVLEIIEKHKSFIPARIDFKDLNKDLINILKDIWHVNKSTCERILNEGNVVLLIDNIEFSHSNQEALTVINDFCKKYNQCKFIGTSLEKRYRDISFDAEVLSSITYQRIEIEEFRTKQITELAKKWISHDGSSLNIKKLDLIIDAFSRFNLPRTPFSVSMFLWILEREETYQAQNNSVLIESFIEKILKSKDGKAIGSRQVFDYKNKLVLLAEIAYKMLEADRENYSLPHSQVLSFVEKYLESLKFKSIYIPRKILNDLLDTGILIEEGADIRFRFACFFEFMLAKHMEYNSDFKAYVLNENNFPRFYNEIIYYTGLHRKETEILRMLIEQLEYHYIDINDIVFKRVKSIDDFFNVDRSLVEQITVDDLLNVLPEKQTEEEKNKQADTEYELQSTAEDQNVIKRKDTNKFNTYNRVLLLAMNVLRNSEEIRETDMKANSFRIILQNSISYCILYKLICESFVKHSDKFPKERIEEFLFVLRILPNVHLELLSANIGSFKLSEVFKAKIEEDYININYVSEFERFLSVFLYADVRGTDYKNIASNFIQSFKKKYIADACYFKLLLYYYKSTDKDFDKYLLRNLVDLCSVVNKGKSKNKRIDKDRVIRNIIESRKNKNLKYRL